MIFNYAVRTNKFFSASARTTSITVTVNVVDFNLLLSHRDLGDRGSTVVKALCYKSEGRWFDSRLCHWYYSLT